MGSARPRVLIICWEGHEPKREAPNPGLLLPVPTECPRHRSAAPCPRSHNGTGMGTEDGKSPGSRWEAWRNPSRSHLTGGSSVHPAPPCVPAPGAPAGRNQWLGETKQNASRYREQLSTASWRAPAPVHFAGGAWCEGVGCSAPWLGA